MWGWTSGISKAAIVTGGVSTANVLCTPGSDDNHFNVASGPTSPLVGVIMTTTTSDIPTVEVQVSGIANVLISQAVTRGQEITSDANGNGVPVTSYPPGTGVWSIGIALQSGVAGQIIPVLIEPDFLEPLALGSITQPMMAPLGAAVTVPAAGGTITAAQMEGSGIFEITPTGAVNVTTDTAANLLAGMPGAQVGTWFDFTLICLAAYAATLVGGANVAVVGSAVANNSSAKFRAVFTNVTSGSVAVSVYRT